MTRTDWYLLAALALLCTGLLWGLRLIQRNACEDDPTHAVCWTLRSHPRR